MSIVTARSPLNERRVSGRAVARRSLAVIACAILFSACHDVDVITSTYATVDEARQAGAFDNRTIPPLLPPHAVDIREAHDLRSSRQWGLFSFPPEDAQALRGALDVNSLSIGGVDAQMPGRIEWWPLILRGRIDAEQIKIAGLEAHRAREGAHILVVNWAQGRAYYWHE